jgi:carboxyl-terminal processing protease
MATTPGLEVSFAKLSDEAARESFVNSCNQLLIDINTAAAPNDDALRSRIIAQLWQANRQTIDLPQEVFTAEFAAGAFSNLDDFTNMIWPYDVEEFNKSTQGEFQGIGIQIDTDEDGGLKVVSPIEDTPAYRAGIKAGDVITHINGKNAKGITINQAVKNITGPEGTTVRLTVRSPDNAVKDYEIRRAKILVNSVKGWIRQPGGAWDYLVDKDSKIGYVRLTNFTKTTAEELTKAIDQIENSGARAMILDLRYNPGGLLNAATEVSDHFLDGGTIVSTKSERRPQDEQITEAQHDTDDVRLPMVVLVNQYSASASEIVSGALRDQKRALVVGERTFGKGSVQMLFQVDGRVAFLKLTTSHYYLPGGTCIHREDTSDKWGVEPDVTVSMTAEQMRKANEIRSQQDVLRDAAAPATQPVASGDGKTALDVDPQLSAAVLLLRLQLAGAKI